jgi:hypothetical protein
MHKCLHLPPALPGEDYQFNNDDFTDKVINTDPLAHLLNRKFTTS